MLKIKDRFKIDRLRKDRLKVGTKTKKSTKLISVGKRILDKPLNIALSASACLLLAFALTFAIASSRPSSEAMTLSATALDPANF